MVSTKLIEDRLLAYLREDVECDQTERDGRLGCITPLEYPNGDNVTVWITQAETGLEVTDYGEATSEAVLGGHAPKALARVAAGLARGHNVTYADSRLTATADERAIGECVWRVASVASQIAHAALSSRKQRVYKTVAPLRSFSLEVESTLVLRDLHPLRQQPLEGSSGHKYQVSLFLPESETVLEPIHALHVQAPDVASAYLKFGDLRSANGYRLVSLLDDREQAPEPEVGRLLTQVSTVVWWSRHEPWLASL